MELIILNISLFIFTVLGCFVCLCLFVLLLMWIIYFVVHFQWATLFEINVHLFIYNYLFVFNSQQQFVCVCVWKLRKQSFGWISIHLFWDNLNFQFWTLAIKFGRFASHRWNIYLNGFAVFLVFRVYVDRGKNHLCFRWSDILYITFPKN